MSIELPYKNIDKRDWINVTEELIERHPLKPIEIIDVVLASWNNILNSSFGVYKVGEHIFPKPQIIGSLLHELIPKELSNRHPEWRGERDIADKDIVYDPDDHFSIELKTSSNPKHVYGNRSFAKQEVKNKKSKGGYYIAVNFQKFNHDTDTQPEINLIRFGWLDHVDWVGQNSSSGQQARLLPETYDLKFKTIFSHNGFTKQEFSQGQILN